MKYVMLFVLLGTLVGCNRLQEQSQSIDFSPIIDVHVDSQANSAYGAQERPQLNARKNEDAHIDDLRRAELQGRIRELRRQIAEESCR